MSTSATGRVIVAEGASPPLPGLTVVARDVSALFPFDIGTSEPSDSSGDFSLQYEDDAFANQFGVRRLEFRVRDRVHRVVHSFEMDDRPETTLNLGVVLIPGPDATGWLVTRLTGTPSPPVSKKNAISVLVDNVVAWRQVADVVKGAQSSIELMQLNIDVPKRFDANPANEEPVGVLQFAPPVPTAAAPRPVNANDQRLERLLLAAVARNPSVDVRVLAWDWVVDGHVMGASLILPGLGFILLLVAANIAGAIGAGTSIDELKHYFGASPLPAKRVLPTVSSLFGPIHAKLAIVDAKTVVSIASPFDQGYFGDAEHSVDDPRRGHSDHVPIHDVSLVVTGPAVFHAHDTYRLHWNAAAEPSDQLTPITPPDEQTSPGPLEALASLQVVRTLASNKFTDPFTDLSKGEKGVLEAYLRAIANAQSFIYLENQYFTNDAIGTALRQALTDPARCKLNVILLLNIDPDVPTYPCRQRKLIARIQHGLTDAQRKRFGVFTRWTHEAAAPPDRPNPRIVPTYLHSKVGIVDDSWATVGSANLDGASLDFFQLLHAFQFGDVRNTEVNFLILNGIEQQPATTAVDLLRRRLWAEHLGLEAADHTPNPNDPLLTTPPPGGWVEFWRTRAQAKLTGLKDTPGAPQRIRILPWPDVDQTLSRPREHLAALLGVEQKALPVDPIAGSRRFDFKTGTYRDKTPELDPPPPRKGVDG